MAQTGGRYRMIRWLGRRGAPDVLCWWPQSHRVFFETKAKDGRLSKLQAHEIGKLHADGWTVLVPFSVDDVDKMISDLTHPPG